MGGAPILLACSGGLDSQVLLHAAADVWPAASIFVAHVHHGLQPEADDWLAFCGAVAARIGVPFLSRRLPVLPDRIEGGIEAWARRLRYQALADMASEAGATLVLTAHHANDQLETHHLRLSRGAGALGLGAMRESAPMPGAGQELVLLRPFLNLDRACIADHARRHRLDWVDDPSNQDLRYARNRIRRELAQTLLQDPGSLRQGLLGIAEFQAVADAARRQAREDLARCRLVLAKREATPGTVAGAADSPAPLSRAALSRLPEERAAEAIRLWLAELGCRMPTRAKTAELLRQLVAAASAHARLRHDGTWVLRYRDRIDAAAHLPADVTTTTFRWAGEPWLDVAGQRFLFERVPANAEGLSAGVVDARWLAAGDLVMDAARGGDRLRLDPGGCHRTWKNLSQEHGLPPWLRKALPVLRREGEVVFAAPFGMNLTGLRIGLPAEGAEGSAARSLEEVTGQLEGSAAPPDIEANPLAPRIRIRWLSPPQLARWL